MSPAPRVAPSRRRRIAPWASGRWGLAYFNPIEINRFGNLQVSSGTLRNAVQLLLAGHPVKLFYTYEESARAADLSTIEDLEAVVERYQAERLGEEERAAVLAGATARDRAAGKDAAQVKFEKIAAKLQRSSATSRSVAPCRPRST